MKRIDEELRKPAPKWLNSFFERYSLGLYIAFRAEIENLLFPILLYDTLIDTIRTVTCFTTWASPVRWSGGMVVTRRFHFSITIAFRSGMTLSLFLMEAR
jgi:hypothetical protein